MPNPFLLQAMIGSKLQIQEVPTGDANTMRLVDSSFYNPDLKVESAILEITPPSAQLPVLFNVQAGFSNLYNSSNLKILPAKNYSELVMLPDGIYIIKYSVKPNNKSYVEYNHLRNTSQMLSFNREIYELFSNRAIMSKREFQQRRESLTWIKELIDAAKVLVEDYQRVVDGVGLYNEANTLLTKLTKSGGTCY